MNSDCIREPTKLYYTLIYAERPSTSDTLVTLNGPTIHTSYDNALGVVWKYVKNRITDAFQSEFVESVSDFGIKLLDYTNDDDEAVAADQLESILKSIESHQISQVVIWYFDLIGDEICEAFYKIDEHKVENDHARSAWKDNHIQFPRLLAEIGAVADLSVEQIDDIAESMDLEPAEVHALFVRAESDFDSIKKAELNSCKRCGSQLRLDAYCVEAVCPHSDWPQLADIDRLQIVDAETYQRETGYLKRIPVDAEAHSDDLVVEVAFDAAPYFYNELQKGNLLGVLEPLDGCDFRGDYPADTVAEFFSENETGPLFRYMNIKAGFECSIDRASVVNWLQAFAPKFVRFVN